MVRTIAQSAAIALPCTALAQPSDYRVTEATQACERLDVVHRSVEDAKRGIGGSRLGCTSVPKGTEVRLITHKGGWIRDGVILSLQESRISAV